MSNNQANIEDLLDELYDVMDKGWGLPLSGGKVFVDAEEARSILEEIRDAIPAEIRKAKNIVAEREKILEQAQREAEAALRLTQEKIKKLVNENNIVREAQMQANQIMLDGQAKMKEMAKASSEYIDDIMKQADDSLSSSLAQLRQTRQNIKAAQK